MHSKKADKKYWETNKVKIRESHKRYYEKNKENITKVYRDIYQKNRYIAIEHYTHGTLKCSCCGEDDVNVLTVDHINNDGAEHRKEIGHGSIYRWLILNQFPNGYQILCANCNMVKQTKSNCEYRKNKYG